MFAPKARQQRLRGRSERVATKAAKDTIKENGERDSTGSEREEVARLAYSYWVSRGRQGGSPEEDWLRAEAEYRARERHSLSA